jgi:hypothetical protein
MFNRFLFFKTSQRNIDLNNGKKTILKNYATDNIKFYLFASEGKTALALAEYEKIPD